MVIVLLIAFIIITWILSVIIDLQNNSSDNVNYEENNDYSKKYQRKSFMTETEKEFFYKIIKLEEKYNVKVVPQVNLATVITNINKHRFQNELFRNIDFGFFDSEYNKLLLLIELNDKTHFTKKRIYRDNKVKRICYDAGIKIISFYAYKENNEDYVNNRIYNYIKDDLY